MKRLNRSILIAVMACTIAVSALAIFQLRYSHAAAWRLSADDQAHVTRALAAAEADMPMTRDEIQLTTRPFVRRYPDHVCVTLRTATVRPDGTYEACFARATGEFVSSRLSGPSFGGPPLWDRVKDAFSALVW